MYNTLSPLIVPTWQEAQVSVWWLAGQASATHFDWSALQSERGPAAADLVSSRPALVQEFPPVLIFCLREREGNKWKWKKWKWGEEIVMSASALAVGRVLRSEGKGALGSDAVMDWFSSETARSSHQLSTCIWDQQPQHRKHNPLHHNSKTHTRAQSHKHTPGSMIYRSTHGKEKKRKSNLKHVS